MYIQITKQFKDFFLSIDRQEQSRRIGVLGASGCGKSMMLKAIAGILTPDAGVIDTGKYVLFDSEQKINLTPQKRRVGYLFQNYALFPNMTVKENIAVGVWGSADSEEKVTEALEKFKLSGLEKRYPHQLSGGQQQRVALARILVYRPDVILLDEPFSAMDAHLKLQLQEELKEMTSDYEGIMMMVSHSRDEIYYFADRIWIMDEGKIVCSGEKQQIFHAPNHVVAAKLTGCKNIFPAKRLDAHRLLVEDLDLVMEFEQNLSKKIHAIGYRAHDFLPIWGEKGEDCIQAKLHSKVDLPFETNFYLHSKGENRLVWMVQRDGKCEIEQKGFPPYLKLLKEQVLLLES